MNPKVAIIIVNWNGLDFLENCLEAIRRQTYKNYAVYFVDNGSIDKSVAYVHENFPEVFITQLDHNTGFAKGNNIGINAAFKDPGIKYVLTLNNDTRIKNNFLEELVKMAESDNVIGAVAPKIIYYYQPGVIDSVGVDVGIDGGGLGRGSTEQDNYQYDQTAEVFGVCAGAALYRRKALEDVMINDEIFDDVFFAYYEDFDLAWRLRLMGWKAVACPQAVVYHIHSGTAKSFSPFKSYHINRNRFFVMIKDLPNIYFWRALTITPYRYLLLFNSIRIKKGSAHRLSQNTSPWLPVRITLKGWLSVVRYLPNMLRKRWHIQRHKKVSNKTVAYWFKNFGISMKEMIYKT